MEFKQLMKLVEQVSESGLESFSYKEGDFSIKMSKAVKPQKIQTENGYFQEVNASLENNVPYEKNFRTERDFYQEKVEASKEEIEEKASGTEVKSPLVGVFYVAPAEGEEPFVKVGDIVKKGQTLAIVEAMKLMNEIEAEYDGVIKEICVGNGEAVEYGQNLFIIQTEENK